MTLLCLEEERGEERERGEDEKGEGRERGGGRGEREVTIVHLDIKRGRGKKVGRRRFESSCNHTPCTWGDIRSLCAVYPPR